MSDQVYIYPTDTVWGIGANIYSKKGQDLIREIKKSSGEKPMSVLFPGKKILKEFVDYPDSWNPLFDMEISFLIPKKWIKKEVPEWVANGPFLGIRCLENEELEAILEKEGAPVTSTSLNLTGKGPITNIDDAKVFQKNSAQTAEIVQISDHDMSGTSSTIIKVIEKNKYEIIRSGTNIEDIKNILGLSST